MKDPMYTKMDSSTTPRPNLELYIRQEVLIYQIGTYIPSTNFDQLG